MKRLFFLVLFLALAGQAWGATWYVSDAGAGSKDGTSAENAWEDFSGITWGVGGVQAGDTLYILGTVAEQELSVGVSGTDLSAGLLDIRGDYPGNPGVIDNNAAVGRALTVNAKNYIRIRNLTIEDDHALVLDSSHIYFSGVTFQNMGGLASQCLQIKDGSDNHVVNCTFTATNCAHAAVWLEYENGPGNLENTTVESCTISGFADGIKTDTGANLGTGIEFKNNTISTMSENGIQVGDGGAVVVSGNSISGTLDSAIIIWGGDVTGTVVERNFIDSSRGIISQGINTVIRNNIIIAEDYGIIFGDTNNDPPVGCSVINNSIVITNSGGKGFLVQDTGDSLYGAEFINNILYCKSGASYLVEFEDDTPDDVDAGLNGNAVDFSYNQFYHEDGDTNKFNTFDGNYTTATFQSTYTNVANNLSHADPLFVNPGGAMWYHYVPKNKAVYSGGTAIVGITTDYKGFKHVGTTPIGALDFALIRMPYGRD